MRRGLFGLGWLAGAALAFAVPVSAQAGSGYLSVNLNLRAGPSVDYPAVRLAPRGAAVNVYGCVDDYGWCDVSWGGNRGWVSGQYLDYDYDHRRVPVIAYGPRLGLGLISFNFGNYWNNHYRHQSWYGQRNHYSHVVVRYGSPRHHGYYSTRHRSTADIRHDRHDRRYDRPHRYQRNEARNDYRRDVRNDVQQDRRQVHNDVRQDRRQASASRQANRQSTRSERNSRRQVSRNRQNGHHGRNTERQR